MKSSTIVLTLVLISCILLGAASFASAGISSAVVSSASMATPIKHIVIIFQENVSFDHYFATYSHAMSGVNGSKFTSDQHTLSINGLSASPALLTNNTNYANPFRLNPSQQRTCDITTHTLVNKKNTMED